jgi:hypothetical protein
MLYCNNCEQFFDDPATAIEMHYEVDTRRGREYSVCPYCCSNDIDERWPEDEETD